MIKKAITHLKLNHTNKGKKKKLESVATEYMRVTQAYVNFLIQHEMKEPLKFASIPEQDVPTPLSQRWQRCAWQQACGIVQSWYSNECQNPPLLRNICIQANANVVKLETSRTPTFDYWLRISTMVSGKPVRIPIKLYDRAKETIAEFPKLCTSVTLNERKGEWYATFVVERKTKKPSPKEVVGVDIGMVSIVSTSKGHHYGQISEELRKRIEKSAQKRRRKQKLNACLKRKGRPEVSLSDSRAEAYSKNEIGHALNLMISEIPNPNDASVAIERLSVKDMRFKSRQMNRALRTSQLAHVRDKLKFKLDEQGIRYRSVQPAYSSQQCSKCGFTLKMNRRNQSEFLCLFCGYSANADFNAALNIAERFGDDELNKLSFREVETVLAIRFLRRHPVACSATAGPLRDTVQLWLP
jgi:IS605 OrfB family transposase